MMKIKATCLLLLVSLLVAGACAAGSAEEGKKKNKTGIYVGEVVDVDNKSHKMLLAKRNSELAMVLNTSRAKVGPGYAGLSEVKVGDRVEVAFEAKVGQMYALKVSKSKKEALDEPKPEKSKQEKPKDHP